MNSLILSSGACLALLTLLYAIAGVYAFFTALSSALDTGLNVWLSVPFAVFCGLLWPLLLLGGRK